MQTPSKPYRRFSQTISSHPITTVCLCDCLLLPRLVMCMFHSDRIYRLLLPCRTVYVCTDRTCLRRWLHSYSEMKPENPRLADITGWTPPIVVRLVWHTLTQLNELFFRKKKLPLNTRSIPSCTMHQDACIYVAALCDFSWSVIWIDAWDQMTNLQRRLL